LGGEAAEGGFGGGEGLLDAVEAGHDALDVAIDHIGRLVERGGGHDGSGVGAQAGEGKEGGFGRGEVAGVFGYHNLRAAVQQVRAAVVAEALPVVEDVGDGGCGQALHGGEAGQKALVIGDDGGDGGLLEHDLGQPDVVGRGGGRAPGHAAVATCIPRQQGGLELLRGDVVGGLHVC